jgi:hypothetical protein
MRIARSLGSLIFVAALSASLGGCWSGLYENPAAQYVNRSDTITLSAGDAKNVNAATHVIDPWPRHVRDRRIPGNGERMAGAVQRYQRPQAGRAAGQGQGRVGATTGDVAGGQQPGGLTGTAAPTAVPAN